MRNSEEWQKVKQELKDNTIDTTIFQKRPNTAVRVRTFHACIKDNQLVALGFSKVSYPDVWDPVFGIKIATDKAIEDIARWVMRATAE